jgi:hypothetical protein
MYNRPETYESPAWTLLRIVLFFLMAIATPLSLIAAIVLLAVNGLYSFDATGATLLTFLILWLSSPLIVSFAYATCSLAGRRRELSEREAKANAQVRGPSPQQTRLRLISGGRTHVIDQKIAYLRIADR